MRQLCTHPDATLANLANICVLCSYVHVASTRIQIYTNFCKTDFSKLTHTTRRPPTLLIGNAHYVHWTAGSAGTPIESQVVCSAGASVQTLAGARTGGEPLAVRRVSRRNAQRTWDGRVSRKLAGVSCPLACRVRQQAFLRTHVQRYYVCNLWRLRGTKEAMRWWRALIYSTLSADEYTLVTDFIYSIENLIFSVIFYIKMILE